MIIKVSGSTAVSSLFGCIMNVLDDGDVAEVSAVGANALNQMFKACAIAAEKRGDTMRCTPKLSKNDKGTTFCVMLLKNTA